jgi:hypothetical protein
LGIAFGLGSVLVLALGLYIHLHDRKTSHR